MTLKSYTDIFISIISYDNNYINVKKYFLELINNGWNFRKILESLILKFKMYELKEITHDDIYKIFNTFILLEKKYNKGLDINNIDLNNWILWADIIPAENDYQSSIYRVMFKDNDILSMYL